MTAKHNTREEWLTAAIAAVAPLFVANGHQLPAVRVSVGFPGGRGNKTSVIGQCWQPAASADGIGQIFVSPILGDAPTVLSTLVHELVHAVNHANGDSGHGKEFSAIAKPLGLVGKMTATTAGETLAANLAATSTLLGDYPHAALTPALSGVKKQGTRMLKVTCPEDGYQLRTTAKWLAVGVPTCPCGTEMEAEVPSE
ncbi:SprT-like domain-containing protein [Kribbella sp. CA-293567]|uniref:SprT-like domain-containing protein n=1 Tax=Kribbella sp. CA-293567 TaxID=3002436 RepID=UPI0022DDD57A|nr:SprT-like domain-containing protein [Kribbella sp. CA-293567]WBQ03828.1 SprT-like domain-containing protein [Kribbella sp. CA-293567]